MSFKKAFLIFLLCLVASSTYAENLKLFKELIKPADKNLSQYLKQQRTLSQEFESYLDTYREKALEPEATNEDKVNLAAILLAKVMIQREEPYETIEPLLIEAADLVNDNATIETIWGDILYTKQDYENALSHYEIALNQNSDDIDLIGKYGLAKTVLQNFDTAIDYLVKYLEKNPDDYYMLYLAGQCEFELKHYEEAIEYYTKAKEYTQDEKYKNTLDELIRKAKEYLASTSDSETDEDQRFIITFAGNSKDDLGDITFDILDEIYYDVTNLIGVNPDVKINIIFFLTEDYYKQGQSWSAGGAQGLKILIPLKSGYKSQEYVKGLLAHEFTHTMINLKTNNRAPLWVHEGLAQYQEYSVTNGSPDVLRSDFQRVLQNDFIDGDLTIPLDKVPAYIGGNDDRNVARGYVVSYMAIRCLGEFYGESSFDTLLTAIGQGKRIPEAIEAATGKDYADFQSEVNAYIKNQ